MTDDEAPTREQDDAPTQEQIDYFRALADMVAQRRMPQTKSGLSGAIRGLRQQQRALGLKDRTPDDWFAYHLQALEEIKAGQRFLAADEKEDDGEAA